MTTLHTCWFAESTRLASPAHPHRLTTYSHALVLHAYCLSRLINEKRVRYGTRKWKTNENASNLPRRLRPHLDRYVVSACAHSCRLLIPVTSPAAASWSLSLPRCIVILIVTPGVKIKGVDIGGLWCTICAHLVLSCFHAYLLIRVLAFTMLSAQYLIGVVW